MNSYSDSRLHTPPRRSRGFPAYGPVDALLGLLLFYYLVDAATPTVVAVLTDARVGLAAGDVRFGLAAFVWFVLAVTVVEQVRRQLAALGVVGDAARPSDFWDRVVPTEAQSLWWLALALGFGLIAAWTFESAVETAVSMIRVVTALDADAFVLGEFVVMVVFFVSYGVASDALDRLLVGGLRTLVAETAPARG